MSIALRALAVPHRLRERPPPEAEAAWVSVFGTGLESGLEPVSNLLDSRPQIL